MMEFREKLYTLRKERKMSQEDLGEILEVSRQAVQKWEAGTAAPDMKNLIAISQYFETSLDVLLKKELSLDDAKKQESTSSPKPALYPRHYEYEYKSERTLFGLPLVHINLGYGYRKAKGILAIGKVAVGVVAIGALAFGLFSLGALSLGLLALGGLSLGGLVLGGLAVGIVAIGGVSAGVLAIGGAAFGVYAIGGLAIASQIALGDIARGHLAIGRDVYGVHSAAGALSPHRVREIIMQEYPRIWEPLTWLFSIFSPR